MLAEIPAETMQFDPPELSEASYVGHLGYTIMCTPTRSSFLTRRVAGETVDMWLLAGALYAIDAVLLAVHWLA